MQENLSHCRKQLREYDYPRYLLSLTCERDVQQKLWVLGALNVELSRAVEMSEPATGAIRLKWWLEALQEDREHPLVKALHEMNFSPEPLQKAIEAREADLEPDYPFADIKALDVYATAVGRMWQVLTEDEEQRDWLVRLGQLWVLQGLVWSTGYHLSQGRCVIPREVAAAHGIDPLIDEGDISEPLCHMVKTLARRVEETLKRVERPDGALLHRALPFIQWRMKKVQQNPMLALAKNPPELRIAMLWQFMFAKLPEHQNVSF